MDVALDWKDYELIDMGDGEKLERWGKVILSRPDPQAIWPKSDRSLWQDAHAVYTRSDSGGGSWKYNKKVPGHWTVGYKDFKFFIQLMGFKHTGLFPEQAVNWEWMTDKIKLSGRKDIKVLNLFGYTGGATVACSYAGAEVCHVDAAKGMVNRCSENVAASGLKDRTVRYIVDDVFKFVKRENRRGKKYDAIIMDPPSYGRGPNGEVWKIEDSIYDIVKECRQLLSDDAIFFLINSYTAGFSPTVPMNIMEYTIKIEHGGKLSCGEVGLRASSSGLVLPCGIYSRWESLPL